MKDSKQNFHHRTRRQRIKREKRLQKDAIKTFKNLCEWFQWQISCSWPLTLINEAVRKEFPTAQYNTPNDLSYEWSEWEGFYISIANGYTIFVKGFGPPRTEGENDRPIDTIRLYRKNQLLKWHSPMGIL